MRTRIASARRTLRARVTLLAVAPMLLLPLRAATAQFSQFEQPIVFQHGILSDSATWASIALQFGIGYHVADRRFTTGSLNTYEAQAGVLAARMSGFPDTTILVGHSNGGIVSRQLARSRRLKGIITVGTPHRGAGIMRSVANGTAAAYVDYFAHRIADPMSVYGDWLNDSWYWNVIGRVGDWILYYEQAVPALIGAFATANQGLIGEMTPGSGFLGGLNAPDNLAHEASVVPARVGIVSTIGHEGMIFRSNLSQSTTNYAEDARYGVASAYLYAYDHYADYDDYNDPYLYEKRLYAGLWWDGYVALLNMDDDWCYVIGGTDVGYCEPTDGIVPQSSQVYPGYTNLTSYGGASHGEETSSDATFAKLRDILLSAPFSVTVRHIPDTFSPYMSGSTDVSTAPGCSIMYTAHMPDGSEANVQQWDSDGNLQPWGGGNAIVSWSVVSGGHYVSALIDDGSGNAIWIGIDGIQASPYGMDCHNY